MVMHISGGKDSFDIGFLGSRSHLNITGIVQIQLSVEDRRIGSMTNGVKKSCDFDFSLFLSLDIFQTRAGQIIRADGIFQNGVPDDFQFRIFECPLPHDLGSAKLIAPVHQINYRTKLCQISGFFHRRIPSADNHQRLVAKHGKRTITNSTGRHAVVPHFFFIGDSHPLRRRPGGNDHRMRTHFAVLGFQNKRPLAEIGRGHIFLHHFGAETLGLLAEQLHQLRPANSFGKSRIIFNFGGGGQLSTC